MTNIIDLITSILGLLTALLSLYVIFAQLHSNKNSNHISSMKNNVMISNSNNIIGNNNTVIKNSNFSTTKNNTNYNNYNGSNSDSNYMVDLLLLVVLVCSVYAQNKILSFVVVAVFFFLDLVFLFINREKYSQPKYKIILFAVFSVLTYISLILFNVFYKDNLLKDLLTSAILFLLIYISVTGVLKAILVCICEKYKLRFFFLAKIEPKYELIYNFSTWLSICGIFIVAISFFFASNFFKMI